MIEIHLTHASILERVQQMQRYIGGDIRQEWGAYTLEVDNSRAKGYITYMGFDWGVTLIDFNLNFFEPVLLITGSENFNPLYFFYCTKGNFEHKFNHETKKHRVEQFHSVIIAGSSNSLHELYFEKNRAIKLNIISISRKQFLNKRLNISEMLNEKLHDVFVDTQHQNEFAYYGPISLKMADYVKALQDVDTQGMIRNLQIEGTVYQLLSMHIKTHNSYEQAVPVEISLSESELRSIRNFAEKISKDPSKNYTLEDISLNTGLSQVKLQDGFKFLYAKTVSEYIRHVRLEEARDLMHNSNLNISQIVYSIGFTSRSYFSKIFKKKYGISPSAFKKQISLHLEEGFTSK
ncbi:AraC family transcriptional regulator [Gaetbulibacter aestuarii]|uniref:AraC family transcriptional regulator n=1 Tax=Gaetbulibacter aestuarii TaxID=1502358 RepID=A0ABW7MVG8_9FLAO